MTTIADVRQQLADIASTLDGWMGTPYVGDSLDAPVVKVSRPAFDPRFVFQGGKYNIAFRLTAYVKRLETDVNEALLDSLCELTGDGSLIAAIQDEANWSITVDYAQVANVGETFATAFGTDSGEYLAVPFDVEVVW